VEENENLFFRIDEEWQGVEGKAYEADEIESEVESLLLVENLVEDRFANLICRGESDRLEVNNKLQEEETALVERKPSEVVDGTLLKILKVIECEVEVVNLQRNERLVRDQTKGRRGKNATYIEQIFFVLEVDRRDHKSGSLSCRDHSNQQFDRPRQVCPILCSDSRFHSTLCVLEVVLDTLLCSNRIEEELRSKVLRKMDWVETLEEEWEVGEVQHEAVEI